MFIGGGLLFIQTYFEASKWITSLNESDDMFSHWYTEAWKKGGYSSLEYTIIQKLIVISFQWPSVSCFFFVALILSYTLISWPLLIVSSKWIKSEEGDETCPGDL